MCIKGEPAYWRVLKGMEGVFAVPMYMYKSG